LEGKDPIIIPTGFGIHRRWLALGFRNHQQYYFETYEPKKTFVFFGKKDSLLKNIMLGGFNRFNPQTWRPRIAFFLVVHDFIDFLGRLMFLVG